QARRHPERAAAALHHPRRIQRAGGAEGAARAHAAGGAGRRGPRDLHCAGHSELFSAPSTALTARIARQHALFLLELWKPATPVRPAIASLRPLPPVDKGPPCPTTHRWLPSRHACASTWKPPTAP